MRSDRIRGAVRHHPAVAHLVRRGRAAAISRSWVMTTTVVPEACSSRRSARTAAPDAESRFPVGSSASRTAGPPTTARATATRWRSPPESWCGRWWTRWLSPTRARAAAARARRRRSGIPAYSRPSATESRTGTPTARWNCWKTKPIRVARSAETSRSVSSATSWPSTRTWPADGRFGPGRGRGGWTDRRAEVMKNR
ncbi:hypothetical protein STANM309S_03343 [Streptomyces tanashiensis]